MVIARMAENEGQRHLIKPRYVANAFSQVPFREPKVAFFCFFGKKCEFFFLLSLWYRRLFFVENKTK